MSIEVSIKHSIKILLIFIIFNTTNTIMTSLAKDGGQRFMFVVCCTACVHLCSNSYPVRSFSSVSSFFVPIF